MNITQRGIAWLLTALLSLSPVMAVQADIISNDILLDTTGAQQTRDNLQELLNQQTARQQLLELGISPEWAMERAGSLTDSELARINQGVGQLQAGSGDVLSALLLIFIVFVITDIIGATDIFSFIHPVR